MKLMLGVGLVLLVFGVWMYGSGYHNYDFGWNVVNLNTMGFGQGIEIRDCSGLLGCMKGEDLLQLGALQLDMGLVFGLFGAFLCGLYAHSVEGLNGRHRRKRYGSNRRFETN
jgi:hypothetical protein